MHALLQLFLCALYLQEPVCSIICIREPEGPARACAHGHPLTTRLVITYFDSSSSTKPPPAPAAAPERLIPYVVAPNATTHVVP